MNSLADVIEAATDEILREVRDRGDEQMHELAAQVLRELTGSLRTASTSLPVFPIAIYVDRVIGMLRELSARALDAIESRVSAKELRRVAEWFAATSQRALEDSNRRLVAMLNSLDDHVLLFDTEARVQFLNAATEGAARENYGRSREDMIGRNLMEGEQRKEFKNYIRGLIARASAGETVAEEYLLPVLEGAFWHEHHFHPVSGPGNAVEAVAIVSRRIHARKQAEGRLHLLSKIGLLAETGELDGILARAAGLAIPELADWSIFELLNDGEIVRTTIVHPDAARGAQAEQELSESRAARSKRVAGTQGSARIHRLGHDDDTLRDDDPELHAVLQRHGATTALIVPFHVMGTPIAVATFVFGQESGRRHSLADMNIADEIARRAAQIVENARLHSEVAQALTYRERVMGILGHDLRNPISAVLSLSTTLSQRADVPERTKEGLRHIHKSAERMEQMIASILDFTQLRFRGLPRLALEAFDLEHVVRTVVEELRVANPRRTITVDTVGELHGRWDASRMGQVVSNLVGNALTHGVDDTPVTVSLTAETDHVLVAVTNRGPTIPTEALGKLFEPFWQAPKPEATKSRGLGLGLFIVHQIVQAHGGGIVVRSHSNETTFTVRVPR
jgi:PAS domain S-box-containing protein